MKCLFCGMEEFDNQVLIATKDVDGVTYAVSVADGIAVCANCNSNLVSAEVISKIHKSFEMHEKYLAQDEIKEE